MLKHKNKIIAGAVIIAVLAAAWFWGGNYNKRDGGSPGYASTTPDAHTPAAQSGAAMFAGDATDAAETVGAAQPGTSAATDVGAFAQAAHNTPDGSDTGGTSAAMPDGNAQTDETVLPETLGLLGDTGMPAVSETEKDTEKERGTETGTETGTTSEPPSHEPKATAMSINPESGKDKYLTDPVPEGKPLPIEPEDVTFGDGSFMATLTIRCDTILDNMKRLDKEKHELVPQDGIIFPVAAVTVYEGESVFNVLQRETRRIKLHMSSRFTPIYNSAYIEAINNLYEFDVGELSGWMYCVNGWYPNYGCSRYVLKPGDVIEWNYTCNLGRDLGQDWISSGGGQNDG